MVEADGELQVASAVDTQTDGEVLLSDFIKNLPPDQKAQIAAAANFVESELQKISEREDSINSLLRLN
jgi:cell division protein ZapA (FtsZ GTPase activity inhibitor)